MATKKEQQHRKATITLGIKIPNYYEEYKERRAFRRHQARKIERRLTNYQLQEYLLEYEA